MCILFFRKVSLALLSLIESSIGWKVNVQERDHTRRREVLNLFEGSLLALAQRKPLGVLSAWGARDRRIWREENRPKSAPRKAPRGWQPLTKEQCGCFDRGGYLPYSPRQADSCQGSVDKLRG